MLRHAAFCHYAPPALTLLLIAIDYAATLFDTLYAAAAYAVTIVATLPPAAVIMPVRVRR